MPRDRARPHRMDGYVRVSRRMGREGPGYISPDVQRESIQRWADYRGVEILEWHFDEDESGGTQNRPGLRAAMARIEAGETDGLAVWKIDRFARNVHEAVRDIKTMQARPGSPAVFASVSEDIDPTGPFGDFILTVMLAVATLQRDSLVEGWKTAKARAMDRGVKIGPTPFGYRRREDGTLEPHATDSAIVANAFERAAESDDPLSAALDYLQDLDVRHEAGARAGRPRRWTNTTVRRMLTNRTYLGENRYGERVDLHAHKPLVGRAVWEAAQPAARRGRRPARHYPLSGLATCGTCGERMVGGSSGGNIRTYRCRASLQLWSGHRCPTPSHIVAERLEEHVRELLADALQQSWSYGGDEGALMEAEAALRDAEAELDSLVEDTTVRRSLGPARFQRLVDAHVEAFEEAQLRYREAASAAAAQPVIAEPELIATATPEELGELARGGLVAIVVQPGRGSLDTRVRLVPKGAPTEPRFASAQDSPDSSVEA
jgi:site-specific DNA recombinase